MSWISSLTRVFCFVLFFHMYPHFVPQYRMWILFVLLAFSTAWGKVGCFGPSCPPPPHPAKTSAHPAYDSQGAWLRAPQVDGKSNDPKDSVGEDEKECLQPLLFQDECYWGKKKKVKNRTVVACSEIFGSDKPVRLTADDSSSPDRGLLFLCNTQQTGINSTQVGCWWLLSVTVELKEGKLVPFALHSKEQWCVAVFVKEKSGRFAAVREKIPLVHRLFFNNWCTKPVATCSSPYVLLSAEVFGDCEVQTLDHSDIFIACEVRGASLSDDVTL